MCFFTWDLQTSRGCASLSFATALSSQGDPFSAANPNADADTHGLLLSQVDETTLDICVDLGLSKHKTPRAADSPYKTAFCFKAADSLRLKHRSFTRGRASLWHRCQVQISGHRFLWPGVHFSGNTAESFKPKLRISERCVSQLLFAFCFGGAPWELERPPTSHAAQERPQDGPEALMWVGGDRLLLLGKTRMVGRC